MLGVLGYLGGGGVLPHAQLFPCPGQACCCGQLERKRNAAEEKGNFDEYRSPLLTLEIGDKCCQAKIQQTVLPAQVCE